jgi:uncharacterized membrane protein YjjP (DUF1212 family)
MKTIDLIKTILRLVSKQEHSVDDATKDLKEILQVERFTYFLRGFIIGSITALLIINFLIK